MNIIIASGGYDPIHSGHIAYMSAARALGDRLIVGLNSDAWLVRKKGQAFMPLEERIQIVSNLKMVDQCIAFDDTDGSAIDAIKQVRAMYPNDIITFVNGGDRTAVNIPEMSYKDSNLVFQFGVGGEDKKNSSSWILKEWKEPTTPRPWGEYRVLYDYTSPGRATKVKELTIMPGQTLSLQRHADRSEHWHVVEGMCNVHTDQSIKPPRTLMLHDTVDIAAWAWHRLANPFTSPCKLIEIQYGKECVEGDIERKSI